MEALCEEGPDPEKCPPLNVLIVEDHEPTGKAMTALLRGKLDYVQSVNFNLKVETVPNAESALMRIADSPPDVVVMDISLPGMNGIDATRRVREIAPTLPVIIHSRSDTDIYRAMAAEAGVRAFISKRHTAQELAPAILSILARTHDH